MHAKFEKQGYGYMADLIEEWFDRIDIWLAAVGGAHVRIKHEQLVHDFVVALLPSGHY